VLEDLVDTHKLHHRHVENQGTASPISFAPMATESTAMITAL